MTDTRELLELAARAAGIEVPAIVADGVPHRFGGGYWNPLTSDADAFRLLVDCGMSVHVQRDTVIAKLRRDGVVEKIVNGDKHAAARLAIVRCAAEIGRGKAG